MKEIGCGPGCGCGGSGGGSVSRLTAQGTLRPVDSGPQGFVFRSPSREIDPRSLAIGPYYQPPTFDPQKLLLRPTEPTRTMEDIVRRGYPELRGIDPTQLVVGGIRKPPFVLTATGRMEMPVQSDQGLALASMILTFALQGPDPQALKVVGLEGFGSLQFMGCAKETCKGSLALRVDAAALSEPYAVWQKGDEVEIELPAHIIWTTCRCTGPRMIVSEPIHFGMRLSIPGLERTQTSNVPSSEGLLASVQFESAGKPVATPAELNDGDHEIETRRDFNRPFSPIALVPSPTDKVSMVLKGFRGRGSFERRTVLQPVFLRDSGSPDDQAPRIALFEEALVHAQFIWKKAGVTFVPLPPVVLDINEPRLRRAIHERSSVDFDTDPEHEEDREARTSLLEFLETFLQREGQHRVFFFRSIASPFGVQSYGETKPGTGDANAFIITSQQNDDLAGFHRFHLAHELGHVLGMFHPDEMRPTALGVIGSAGTIMCLADKDRPSFDTNFDRVNNSLWHKANVRNAFYIFVPWSGFKEPAPSPDCCHGGRDQVPPGGCMGLRDCANMCMIVNER